MRKLIDFIRDIADDERIPLQNRVVLGGLLVYLMTPIDLVPDFVPIIGWLDDAFISLIILDYVFNSADTELILQHYPWNKENFHRVKSHVERLSWLVPGRIRKLLFRHASTLAITEPSPKEITQE